MQPLASRPHFVRLLYTNNPFYLLSAALVLGGLHLSFGAHRSGGADGLDRWMLLGALAGYTLLAAAAAFLVVRLGRVWDDARSLMLVLLLQFFAISAALDDFCNSEPDVAPMLALLGFLFSAGVTEALLRSLSIGLPSLFRGPYYLLLALLFAHPLWISPEITHLDVETIRWRLLLFPVCSGLGLLALLPAARRGARYTARNGTPWRWPLYPWTIFLFLALGLGVRSYTQCLSFDRLPAWESVYGGYFLAPLLLAATAVGIEIAATRNKRAAQTTMLLAAPLLLALAARGPSSDANYMAFYEQVTASLGSPLWLTLLGLIALFAFAWQRGAPLAEFGLSALLLALSVVGPATIDSSTLAPLQWPPLLALGGVLMVRGLVCRSSLRLSAATASAAACALLAVRQTALAEHAAPIVAHAALVAVCVIGAALHDWPALLLRKLGAVGMATGATVAAFAPGVIEVSDELRLGYVSAMTLLALGYWALVGEGWSLAAGIVNVGAAISAEAWWLSCLLWRELGREGFITLLAGGACFLVAALISAAKAGLLRQFARLMFRGGGQSIPR